MKQGTKSVLFGCHSPVHSVLVTVAWRKLYGSWPKLWQIVCIFLHDIGHLGTDYLDNYEEKKWHWELGAQIARKLFGYKAFLLVAGHSSHYRTPSALYKADKYSWYIAPRIWIWLNTFAEPELRVGMGRWEAVNDFKANVKKSIESGKWEETHQFYLERSGNG